MKGPIIPCELTPSEDQDFEDMYFILKKDYMNGDKSDSDDLIPVFKWLDQVVHYNVPNGKKIRGKLVPATVKSVKVIPTKDEMRIAYVVGWCIEILQASFLVADDIMDGSETRRGTCCWYKIDNIGTLAFNDSLLLEHTVYQILKKYLSHESYYGDLLQLFLDVTRFTIFGQSLDTRIGVNKDFSELTMERTMSIAKYKTAYYTTYLPVYAGLLISEEKVSSEGKSMLLEIGQFFQVQDDFLDCFGDSSVTGKVGTDIQDFKCTWLIATAKKLCTQEELTILKENYGDEDPSKVAIIKDLYVTLGVSKVYKEFEVSWYENILKSLKNLEKEMPTGIFLSLISKLYNRSK